MDGNNPDFSKMIGQPFEDAVKAIEVDYPGFDVHDVPNNAFVTADYRTDRIRVYYDPDTGCVTDACVG